MYPESLGFPTEKNTMHSYRFCLSVFFSFLYMPPLLLLEDTYMGWQADIFYFQGFKMCFK